MLPFERLRSLARWGDADETLLAEIAGCLADFDDDPPGLVVACRRLLDHHRDWAPLWWLCSRVLASPIPGGAAHAAVGEIAGDRASSALVSGLPFPSDDPVVVLGWPSFADTLLEDRPDLDLVSLMVDPLAEVDEPPVTEVDRFELEHLAPSHLLFAPMACDAVELLAERETGACLDVLPSRTRVWAVTPTGVLLPAPLVEALAVAVDPRGDTTERLSVERIDRFVTGRGMVGPTTIADRLDTPVAPELLRPLP